MKYPHSDRTAGLSICAVAVLSYLVKAHSSVSVIFNVGFLFLWGLRVCLRGVPTAQVAFVEPTACDATISKTFWTWVLCAPTAFAVAFDENEIPIGFPQVGGALCFAALLIDCLERNAAEGQMTRNPYVFSSLTMCFGLFIMHPSAYTAPFPLMFSYIVIAAPGGYRWMENLRASKAKSDIRMDEYMRATSPLVPMPRGCYQRLVNSFIVD